MSTIKFDAENVKMIAHRGLSGIERENTYPAFVAAGNRSYYGIETDVHKTKDGRFVVIHDETTDRVSGGNVKINVENSNYADLENIVLPDTDGSIGRQDIRIPLLADYINICKKYDKVCVLELKNAFSREDICNMVEQIRTLGYLENVIFISFVLENCIILRSILTQNDIQWLIGVKLKDEDIQILAENHLDLDIHYSFLDSDLIKRLHGLGIKVNCWTCDDADAARSLVQMGVDFITSNILEGKCNE